MRPGKSFSIPRPSREQRKLRFSMLGKSKLRSQREPMPSRARRVLRSFLTGWLNDTASQRLRERTLESYRKLVSTYIVPALGDRKLSQLSLPDIDQLYSDMMRVQPGKNKGLSARTVRYTHSVLRSALNHAVKGRLLSHNPTDYATLPRQERKEMLCLKPAEANAFLR